MDPSKKNYTVMFCCIICWREKEKSIFYYYFVQKDPPHRYSHFFFLYSTRLLFLLFCSGQIFEAFIFIFFFFCFLKGVWSFKKKKEGGEMYMYTYSNLFPEVFGLPIFTSWFFVKVVRRGYWEDVYWLSPTHTTFNFQLWSEREREGLKKKGSYE
jgi:hypothetical protein